MYATLISHWKVGSHFNKARVLFRWILLRLYPSCFETSVFVPYMAMCGLSVHLKRELAYLLNFRTDHSDSFKRLNLEHVWGHHFIFLKASWLHSKSTGINVINNYGLPCLTSHYLSFPDVLRLSCLHLFLSVGGWDRQESQGMLVFKYIFGLGFKTGGWKNFQQTSGLENPFVSLDTVLPADILT